MTTTATDFKVLFASRLEAIEKRAEEEREKERLLVLANGDRARAQALERARAWLLSVDLAKELSTSEHTRVVIWDSDCRYREALIGIPVPESCVESIVELFLTVRPDLDCEPAGWRPSSVASWEYGYGTIDPCILYFRPGKSDRGIVRFKNRALEARIASLRRREDKQDDADQDVPA